MMGTGRGQFEWCSNSASFDYGTSRNCTEEEWGQLWFSSKHHERQLQEAGVSRKGRFKMSFPESQPKFTSAPSISLTHRLYRPSHVEEPQTSVTAHSQDVDEHQQTQSSQPRVLIRMDSGRSNKRVQLRR